MDTEAFIEGKMIEVEAQLSKIQDMIVKHSLHLTEAFEKRNRVLEEIKNIKENLSYLKKTAKIVSMERYKKIKDSIKLKTELVEKIGEEINSYNKILNTLNENVEAYNIIKIRLQNELTKTAKIYQFPTK